LLWLIRLHADVHYQYTCSVFCLHSTWRSGIPIIALARLRVVVDFYLPLCGGVYEALSRLLPVAARLTEAGTVSRALEEDSADDQEAVDGQVDYERDSNV
jgi:hypothetical protein